MSQHPFDTITEATLRRRRSAKWSWYPPDVLPAWLAEMDFPLAGPVRDALHAAIDDDDCGYADASGFGEALARWMRTHHEWELAPGDVRLVPDVVTGIEAVLAVSTAPGETVVIDTPVYHPFAATIRAMGRVVAAAPLARAGTRHVLDLDAIGRAYAAGARAHLLCSPHNPTGTVYRRGELEALAELADRYDVLVVSDEIHAPLTLPGAQHLPFPTVSPVAARRSLVLTSASKAWNLAGLKAAAVVASSDAMRALAGRLPIELGFHAGHLGVLAARAALTLGDPWLAEVHAILERNRALLRELLDTHLPGVGYQPPEAGYLAWVDCRPLGLGEDPARTFLARGRVALSSGPLFGVEGAGHARLNIATPRALLVEAVRRMASSRQ